MSELPSLSELRETAFIMRAEGYALEFWSNGTWFIEAPSGEGTEVTEEAVAGALASLFKIFF